MLYGDFTKGYGLIDLVPSFEFEAPLERKVLSHEVNILSAPDDRSGSYHRYRLDGNSILARLGLFTVEIQTGHDYTVMPAPSSTGGSPRRPSPRERSSWPRPQSAGSSPTADEKDAGASEGGEPGARRSWG